MPIQRHPGADLDRDAIQPPVVVDEAELVGLVDDEKLVTRMARLEGDANLVVTMALQGYQGREWEQFATTLVLYAHRVLCAWVRRGRIIHVCRSKRIALSDVTKLPTQEDEIRDLATDVTAIALDAFRKNVLIPGRWRPSGGATLRTFFLGQCLFQFPLAHRTWWRAHKRARTVRPGTETSLALATEHLASPTATPATAAALNRVLAELRETADNDQTQILLSSAVGFTHEEIRQGFGLPTARAAEAACYRRREKLR